MGQSGKYYSQYLNGAEGPSTSSGQKDIPTAENGCGFSGSKEGSYLSESGDSLRATLLDPLTYVLLHHTCFCILFLANFLSTHCIWVLLFSYT